MSSDNTINLIEDELRGKTPRRVRLTKTGANLRNLGMGISAFMILLWGCLTIASLSKLIRLKNAGKVVTASVTENYIVHFKYDIHYVDFSFIPNNFSSFEPSQKHVPAISRMQSSSAINRGGFPRAPSVFSTDFGGKEFKGETTVNQSEYNSMHIGLGITITYLPSDPSVSQLGVVDENMIRSKIVFFGTLGLIIIGVFGGIFGSVLWMLTTQKRLLMSGVAASAYIQSCVPILPYLKESAVKLRYKYSVPRVGEFTGSVIVRPQEVKMLMNPNNATLDAFPEALQCITVLYDPKRPQTSRPYRTMTSMVELGCAK